jgi:predicted RNA binding protein YcfA (HicA-like mRNA interferase family)
LPSGSLPNLGWREVVKALSRGGFHVTHQRGSHIYLTDAERRHKITVPRHDRVRTGTLLSIIEQSGLTREGFLLLLE